ncbi:MAG: hypothetical protein E7161_00610 [Firmicutes bacterium]|nr:hypothetical protein [Bacillota bacterium]
MGLHQEIELRIESLKRAIVQAMEIPEVAAYIQTLKRFANIKFQKDQMSIEAYNKQIDELMKETDKAKEEPNVKLFIGLVESHRSLIATQNALVQNGESRK